MNSVQENKNELEAAVRYCESAISRAKATIESMEFRQQAASKAWHEQTGREAALEREVRELKNELEELSKAYNDEIHETMVWKKAHRELKEVNNLQKEQIEMFQRKMSRMNEMEK